MLTVSLVADLPGERGAATLALRDLGVSPDSVGPASGLDAARSSARSAPGGISANPRPAAETLTQTGVSPSLVSFSWSQSGDITFSSYTLAESTGGPSGPWTTVGTYSPATVTSGGISDLTPGSTAWWQLTENGLFSTTSNVVAVTQPNASALTSYQPGASEAVLNWTNNASYGGEVGFVAYDVYESVNGAPFSVVASLPTVSTLSYTLTGLAGGSGYSVYLETVDCLNCGTSGASQVGTDSNTVTFGTPLPLAVTVRADRTLVDVGEPDLLQCTASGGTPPYTYTWDNGSGTNVTGNASQGFVFAVAGNATVTCIVTDAAHSALSSGVSVSIHSAPSVDLQVSEATPDVGELVSFDCQTALGWTPYASAYAWTFGDGAVATTTTPNTTHRYATANATGESASCQATDAASVSATGTVSVRPFPALRASLALASDTVAPGTPLPITATLSGGSSHYDRYAWALPNGSHAASASLTYVFPATPDAATFVFNGTDSVGGTANATVTVNVTPIAARTTASSHSIDTGHTVAFTALPSGGAGGPYTVLWSFGDGASATSLNASHDYTKAGTFTPTVRVTDRLGQSNLTTLPSVTVTTPPLWIPLWFVALLIAIVLAAVVALLYFRQRRRAAERMRPSVPWAPPTAPNETVRGSKTCPSCGSSNVPLRTTCEVCGADLPKSRTSN